MKTTFALLALLLSVSTFAAGTDTLRLVLEQPDVEKLESGLQEKGFLLSNVKDIHATKGIFPRCPCNALELTFTKVTNGKTSEKKFGVSTSGFGTNLKVTVTPVKD